MDIETISNNLQELSSLTSSLDKEKLQQISLVIKNTIYDSKEKKPTGKKVFICGNGGSAAEADHFMGELVGRYKANRIAFPCICLNTSTASLTCISNDFGYDTIFERQLEALGKEGDILIGLTTSGNSPNIIKAMEKAKQLGMITIALLGKDGGKLRSKTDHEIIIPSQSTARIQEMHLFIIHSICDYLEPQEL